jgi:hypothetical protein
MTFLRLVCGYLRQSPAATPQEVGVIIAADILAFWFGASLLVAWAWARVFGRWDEE